jgi:hypothetical protein
VNDWNSNGPVPIGFVDTCWRVVPFWMTNGVSKLMIDGNCATGVSSGTYTVSLPSLRTFLKSSMPANSALT